jgi:hypothetical protein
VAWGARAILDHDLVKGRRHKREPRSYGRQSRIDILWDRQSTFGGDNDQRRALSQWLNAVGLKRVLTLIDEASIDGASSATVEFADGEYRLKAGPRASHGYLYIVAWMVP